MAPRPTSGLSRLKQWLVGSPLRTVQVSHERLINPIALAIFASDALSSTAYATEEILMVLTQAKEALVAIHYVLPIALGISILIAIVTLSYRQLIFAYPEGGGAYTVARENLSPLAGNVAGASLLIDYTLTVAVSVAAGIAALSSAFPLVHDYRIALACLAVFLITVANLRGVRESGALFSVPSYIFIASFYTLILWGLWRVFQGQVVPLHYPVPHLEEAHEGMALMSLGPLLLLRAFSSGCAALTGLEAISNGTSVFHPPESRNAAQVMGWMSFILGTLFVGLSYLAIQYHVLPYNVDQQNYETVVSQIAAVVSGGRGSFYYLVQGSTMVILLLAANTAFAGFPRLASLIARDGYLPRQFSTLGDKLVFTNGIIILALISMTLIVLFEGDTHRLIPLYAVGVFLGFTLAQVGMVVKWVRERPPLWGYYSLINGFGGLLTAVVLLVIAYTKFSHGAWIVIVLIPAMMYLFRVINHHYAHVAEQLTLEGHMPPDLRRRRQRQTVIVPIGGLQWSVIRALDYAQSLQSDDIRAVYVLLDPNISAKLEERWAEWGLGIPLVLLTSPYRSILEPLLTYIDSVIVEPGVEYITVVLPEFVTAKPWQAALHNQTAVLIRAYLAFRKNVVVTSVRYHLDE